MMRTLGKNGPLVPALGFGAMGISGFYGSILSNEDGFKVLDRAVELGCTFWDTSDSYGDSEVLIGEWFKRTGKRDKVFLATKFALVLEQGKAMGGSFQVRGDREYVHQACEKSLQRLGVDTIDLYYQHRVDQNTPIETTVQAMAELVKAGKVRYLGLCECSAATLRRAHAVHPISAVQIEYSPFTLDIETPENNLLATCRELGVAVVAYSPLSRGLMTGQIKSHADFEEGDVRRFYPRFSPENFSKNLVLVDKFAEVAKRKGVAPGQLTLAWLMAQGDDIFPIPGTRRIKTLEENWGALDVQLTKEEVDEIRAVVNATEIAGGRTPARLLETLAADTPPLTA